VSLFRSRDDRLCEAAAALAPYGFRLDDSLAKGLRAYEPLAELEVPAHYVVGVSGHVEGIPVEAFEYEYATSIQDGSTTYGDQLVVAVQHPAIRGTASFFADPKQWSSAAAFVDAFLWVPPFTLLKAFQLLFESKSPDRTVGDADFDRLYVVHAASDEAARLAIPPALRAAVLRAGFRGTVELRPGVLLYAPSTGRLDSDHAVGAIGLAPYFLGALLPRPAHPMR
jgi:hypothetical protein